MPLPHRPVPFFLLALVCFALVEQAAPPAQATDADSSTICFFAAASTRIPVEEIARDYERQTGIRVLCAFAASSVLVRQMERAAPADLFLSADADWMRTAVELGLVRAESRIDLLANRLVLAVRLPRPPKSLGFWPLWSAMESRVAVGDPDHVPVGKYARAALEGLDLWEDVPPRLLRAADAPSAARLFEMGEADALIAYATDLSPGSGDVYVAPFPPASMPRVVYPLALCVNANSGAELFAEYLKSAEAARVFERHGFAAPHGEATASRAQAGPPVPPSSAPRSPLLQTIGVSLRVSTLAMVLMLGPGLAVGWALARLRFPGKTLVEAAVMLPLVLPPVVTGFLLLETLGQASPLGAWMETRLGLSLAFHQTGAALAAAVMGFPLLARSARAAFESVDPRFEEVAATLGDGPLRRFLKVSLPLAGPGVLAGCVLGFARALGEFGATITFAGNMAGETRTLPLAIYNEMQRPGSDANTRPLVLACAAISVAALVLSQFFVARSRARRKERAT